MIVRQRILQCGDVGEIAVQKERRGRACFLKTRDQLLRHFDLYIEERYAGAV